MRCSLNKRFLLLEKGMLLKADQAKQKNRQVEQEGSTDCCQEEAAAMDADAGADSNAQRSIFMHSCAELIRFLATNN